MSGERRFHDVERRGSVFHDTPLLAVAHGSRDPRSAATIRRLADQVRAQAPGLEVRVAFLDLNEPSVPDALAALRHDGHREVTVVPLLLGSAYHAQVDLPELITTAAARLPGLTVAVADVLGADPLLQELALARVAAAFEPAGSARMRPLFTVTERKTHSYGGSELGVVLTGVGSSQAAANATVARIAARWQARGEFAAVTHAFATCGPPVAAAVAGLHARGIRTVAIAPWFLAPGLLLDRVAAQARATAARAGAAEAEVLVAEPLGGHRSVADVVLARYTAATALTQAA